MQKLHSASHVVYASTTGCAPLRGALRNSASTGCAAIHRGTKSNPEKVNQSQVVSRTF